MRGGKRFSTEVAARLEGYVLRILEGAMSPETNKVKPFLKLRETPIYETEIIVATFPNSAVRERSCPIFSHEC
jgi:hypothetical protein